MMKRLISILLLLTLLTGCGSTPASQDSVPTTAPTEPTQAMVTVECVTGLVSTYEGVEKAITIRYEADGIHIVPNNTGYRYETVLNPLGQVVYELGYNDENILNYRIEYTYDAAGNLVEWLNYDTEDDEVASRTTRTYDEHGRLIKSATNHRRDIPGGYYDYTYDAKGHIASRSYTDTEGVNTWNNTYTCDDSGRIVTGTISYPLYNNSNHEQLGYYTLSYDEAGRLTDQQWTETHRSIFVHYSYIYIYDEAGYLIESREIDKDGDISGMVIYNYDSNHRLVSVVDEVEDATMTFIYDQLELPADLAADAAVFTDTGLIHYYAPMPEYDN